MPFNHDTLVGVRLAQDLANRTPGDGWTVDGLAPVLRDAFVRGAVADSASAAGLTRLAGRLRAVFAKTNEVARVALINELLTESVQTVQVAEHDGLPMHLHFASPDGDLVGRVTAMTAGGLAVFVVEAGNHRLGECAREGCQQVYADTSKNGRRTYCTARCGNLDAVHRYRDRRRR
ncbi:MULTISPECIES: CGNR zinc finger domain-containing protein [unclassified Curtobacterium]|uniref:CGNR zinc finger domain-containing protein n=1 Tax=unclassified Curtobacterium TaxID=257496 RepID=UPI000D8AD7CF|nr:MULTISPECIES: CGNR zinc finger domain-containing protein [unclassified Curtobacterium]PYY55868.1 CGNR zinc finger domain-containing protein [Curtobacterium sp. MCSS17_011]WIE79196.1 CGNR zinc finger domain-containing protein [Curtobacterium sp. MCSS17_016]